MRQFDPVSWSIEREKRAVKNYTGPQSTLGSLTEAPLLSRGACGFWACLVIEKDILQSKAVAEVLHRTRGGVHDLPHHRELWQGEGSPVVSWGLFKFSTWRVNGVIALSLEGLIWRWGMCELSVHRKNLVKLNFNGPFWRRKTIAVQLLWDFIHLKSWNSRSLRYVVTTEKTNVNLTPSLSYWVTVPMLLTLVEVSLSIKWW